MDSLKLIIENAIKGSMTYQKYAELISEYAKIGKSTGKQTEDLIFYTKLNASRSKRILKTIQVNDDLKREISKINRPQTWLVITESWCGDAAQLLPILYKVSTENPAISFRVALRDQDTQLIDQFLTNGGRSIPKLIVLNEDLEVLFTWGPRPAEAQAMYLGWQNRPEPKEPYKEFQEKLQKWYHQDSGQSLMKELLLNLSEQSEILSV
ncbi:MAG: thioredoxin family protein [Cyclobacteriaceae bacterium]|nr:thioredoxin family protein [Cyclobacteriaceae bacterium HetDA_MAG_MS6]